MCFLGVFDKFWNRLCFPGVFDKLWDRAGSCASQVSLISFGIGLWVVLPRLTVFDKVGTVLWVVLPTLAVVFAIYLWVVQFS